MPRHAIPPARPIAPGIRRRRIHRWVAVAVWASVIFGASSLHGSQVPGRFGALAHFLEYAVLGVLVAGALRVDHAQSRSAVLGVTLASLYAITDEFHQAFVPGRVPDPLDWGTDTLGALCGVVVMLLASRLRRRDR